MRKITFISLVLIGLATNAKAQSASKATNNGDDPQYVSLLSFVGNKLFDEIKKRFNLTPSSSVKKEETASGTRINYDLATRNNKIKVSGSFTR